jgi:predicted MFS family arabinose efflux permease
VTSETLETRSLAWKVGFSALLAAGMAAGTVIVQVIGVLAPFLLADLGLSRFQLGLLVTASAGMGAVASLPAGRVTDALGGRRVLAGTFGVATVGLAALALAPSFGWALGATLMAGLANAACNPSTNKLLAVHLSAGQRGLITGVKQSGVHVGYFLAGALLPTGALILGWRPAVGLTAVVVGAAMALAYLLLPADPPAASPPPALAGPFRYSPAIRWLAAYGFLMGAGVAGVVSYLPLYAHEAVGLSVTAAGGVAAFAGLVAVPARIIWSRQSERVHHFSSPLLFIALVSVVATLAIWGAAAGVPLLWVGAFAAGISLLAWNAVGMLAVVVVAETRHTGRASGLVLFGFLAGFMVSPVVFGLSVDVTGSYGPGWAGTALIFLLAAGVARAWGGKVRASEPAHAGRA